MDPLEDPLGAAMQMAYGSSPGSLHSPLEEGKDEGHATNRQDAEAIVQGVEGKGSAANDSNESLLALFSAKEGGNAKQENEKLEREEEEEGEDLMKALDDPHDYDRSDPGRAHPPIISHLDADDVSSDQAPDTTSPPADKEVVEPYLQLSPTLVHAVPDPDDPAVADEADAAANSDDALSFISGLVVDVEAEALIPMHGDIAPRVDHGDDNAAEEKKEGANEPLDVAPIPLYEALLEMESKVQSALEGLRQRTEVRLAAVHQAKLDQVKAEEIIVAKASEGNEEDMLVKDKDKVEAVLADDMAAEADEEEEAQLAKEPVAVEADVQTVQGQEPLVPETENAKEEEPMVEMLAVQEERPDAGDQAEEPPVESTVTEEGITLAKVLAPSDDNVDDCDMDVSTTPIEEPTPVSWVHSDNGWVRSSDGAEQLLEVSLADEAIHDLREDEKEALDVAFVARSGSLPGFAAMDPVELISPAVTEEVRPDEEVVVLTDEMAAEEPATEEASVIEAACEVPAIEDAPAIEDTGEEAVMEVLATQIDAEGSAIEEGLVGENTAKEQGIQEASAIEATAEEQAVEEEALATEIEAEEQAIEVAPVIEASAEVPAIGEALATLIVAQDPAIEETTAAEADGNVSEVSEKATPPAEVGSALLLEEASIDYVDESEQEALNVAALARTPHANEGEGEGDSFHDLIDLDEDEFLKAVQARSDSTFFPIHALASLIVSFAITGGEGCLSESKSGLRQSRPCVVISRSPLFALIAP